MQATGKVSRLVNKMARNGESLNYISNCFFFLTEVEKNLYLMKLSFQDFRN